MAVDDAMRVPSEATQPLHLDSPTVAFPVTVGDPADFTQPLRIPAAVGPKTGIHATLRRIGWGVADQAVSSITNFAVGIVVARSLPAVDFGAFSLAWVTYAVLLNLSRGIGTDPLSVRFSGVPEVEWRSASVRASSTVLLVGLTVGAICAGVGIAIGSPIDNPLSGAFVALGIAAPLLLVQDSWRFAFFAAGRGRSAFLNDLVWAVALVPALFMASGHGVFAFVLAWGAAGAVAAAVGAVQIRILPFDVRGAWAWVRQQRDLGLRYMVENVSISSAAQLRMYGLGAISGLAAVGTVRGAQLLLGPFLALLMGVSLVSVPEAARILRRSPRRLPTFCLLLGGSQAMAGMLWGVALLLLLPAQLGSALLGAVWPTAMALIVPTTLVVMGGSLSDGAMAGLRALGVARRSLRTQIVSAVFYVVLGLVGAFVDGASGSAWGVAAATFIGASVAWWQLRLAMNAHAGTASPGGADPR